MKALQGEMPLVSSTGHLCKVENQAHFREIGKLDIANDLHVPKL